MLLAVPRMRRCHSHVVVLQRGNAWPPVEMRWVLEEIFEFLTDSELCQSLTTCSRWQATASQGAWANVAWTERCESALCMCRSSGSLMAQSAAFGRSAGLWGELREESSRLHCCARGRFLAVAFVPACQIGRRRLRLRRAVEEARRAWRAERAPTEAALASSKRRLRVVVLCVVSSVYLVLPYHEATLLVWWPVRFAWHASSIARLAHDSLAHYSIEAFFFGPGRGESSRRAASSITSWQERLEAVKRGLVVRAKHLRSTWPVAHALTSPDALELRRYAFATSTVCLVVCVALLAAWWRCVWYALGSICAELGLASFDVAERELQLKLFAATSQHVAALRDAEAAEGAFLKITQQEHVPSFFRRRHLPANPYRGHDLPDNNAYSLLGTGSVQKKQNLADRIERDCSKFAAALASSIGRRWRSWSTKCSAFPRFLDMAAELNKPLIRLLVASSAFVLFALLVAVCARETPRERQGLAAIVLRYACRALLILLDAIRQDVLPVCFLLAKFAVTCLHMLLRRAFFGYRALFFAPVLALILTFCQPKDDSDEQQVSSLVEGTTRPFRQRLSDEFAAQNLPTTPA